MNFKNFVSNIFSTKYTLEQYEGRYDAYASADGFIGIDEKKAIASSLNRCDFWTLLDELNGRQHFNQERGIKVNYVYRTITPQKESKYRIVSELMLVLFLLPTRLDYNLHIPFKISWFMDSVMIKWPEKAIYIKEITGIPDVDKKRLFYSSHVKKPEIFKDLL